MGGNPGHDNHVNHQRCFVRTVDCCCCLSFALPEDNETPIGANKAAKPTLDLRQSETEDQETQHQSRANANPEQHPPDDRRRAAGNGARSDGDRVELSGNYTHFAAIFSGQASRQARPGGRPQAS